MITLTQAKKLERLCTRYTLAVERFWRTATTTTTDRAIARLFLAEGWSRKLSEHIDAMRGQV